MNKLNIKVKLIKKLNGFKLGKAYTIEYRIIYNIYNDNKYVIINTLMVSETVLFEHFDITEHQLNKLEIFQ